MHLCRNVGALLLTVAFVVMLALATIVMTIRAVDVLQHPLSSLDDDLYGDSFDECDPLSLSPCF